ncbi:hypothetical protein [Lacticaseibacillus manihotivorans]|jgi:hypothetical protein|uniref:Uncharacterized protein n=2 Tax=Lacticaseibacillus manihotivorans TaxID=88233 RepID=A0A0R1QR62_9LACO|nr:hypothetical protein [Lacticaseibacillus manihotivorans]KRL47190.1 hypothetical protein FD01_GL000359 [Lacticaseibacillus manihotivorans DSM 13343 = JCM 12514]QFQ90502.1 hypothetical protein LM010_03235 [Lacticaseibacillus manihotivorans]
MKTEWVNRFGVAIGIIVAILIYVFIVDSLHWYGWLVEIGWLILLQLFFDQRIRHKKRLLTKMWALAEQLGYGDAEIAELTPKYGRIDWQLAHTDNFQFQPSDVVIAQVTDQLEKDLEARA